MKQLSSAISLAVLLACLSACCSPSAPTYAVKQWTVPDQIEIAHERNALPADSILRPVLDEWERMRRELR